jgi:hypothetical protein
MFDRLDQMSVGVITLRLYRRMEFRHNPYVGNFHRTSSSNKASLPIDLPRHSPHVGSFRHAPAAHGCDSMKSNPSSSSRRNFISNLVMPQKVTKLMRHRYRLCV